MLFSDITINLNWNILTKNFVTFERCDEVREEKFLKNSIFRRV